MNKMTLFRGHAFVREEGGSRVHEDVEHLGGGVEERALGPFSDRGPTMGPLFCGF